MKRSTLTFAAVMSLAAVGCQPHTAHAQQYAPIGIAVTPGYGSDYVFVAWNDQSNPSNYVVDEYQFTNDVLEYNPAPGAYLQAESPTISVGPPYTFAGMTGGYNSNGAFFNPTGYLAFQYSPLGLLAVDQLNVESVANNPPAPSSIPLQVIIPGLAMFNWSQLTYFDEPITVTGLSESYSGDLTFASQVGPFAGYENWTPGGQALGNTAIYLGNSWAGGPTGSCTSYAIGPDGSGRSLYYNSGTGTTYLEELTPNGFEPMFSQPAMRTQMGSLWVPVSVSATQDPYYKGITQLLWDGVTSRTNNSAMVWNFTPGISNPTSEQTIQLPPGSVAVGMAADNNNSNQYEFVKANYMGIQGGAPNYDGCTYVLATDGPNRAMLYQVPVAAGAGNTIVPQQISVAG